MAVPTISFNSGTGSDTAASGSASPASVLSGASAVTVAATNTVALATDAPDLSGVDVTGLALMWVNSGSGRQYSVITAIDNVTKVVTCADNYANSETVSWGLGGERATLDHVDSRTLFADMKPGWTFSLEDDQTISSALAPTIAGDITTGKIKWVSSVVGTQRTITQSANAAHFSLVSANNSFYAFRDLNFACSNGTKTSANAFNFNTSSGAGTQLDFTRCSTDTTNPVQRFMNRTATAIARINFINCVFKNCTSNGINLVSASQQLTFYGCVVRDNGAAGISLDGGASLVLLGNIIESNSGDGLVLGSSIWTPSGTKMVAGNVFYANTDGFDFSASASFAAGLIHANNIYHDNTTGVRGLAVADAVLGMNDYNDYEGNGTDRVNLSAGTNDQTADPQFVDAANGDFAIGTNLKALGWPGVIGVGGSTTSYQDIGAAQRQESAAGGGGIIAQSLIAGGG